MRTSSLLKPPGVAAIRAMSRTAPRSTPRVRHALEATKAGEGRITRGRATFFAKADSSGADVGGRSGTRPSFVQIQAQIRQLGLPALISYGLLNTLYYLTAFSVAWFSFGAQRVAKGATAPEALSGALLTLGVVWGGSQVTKGFRALGAIVLAAPTDRLLAAIAARLPGRARNSKRTAAALIVVACFVLAAAWFGACVASKAIG